MAPLRFRGVSSLPLDQWRMWAPLVSGFAMATMCPMGPNDGATLPQRPPTSAFPIVWTILYLLLGWSWTRVAPLSTNDRMHSVCTLLLLAWLLAYSCHGSPRTALYVLACAIAVTVCCMCLHASHDHNACVALVPLLAWLLIAFHLNWDIVSQR